jgi:hypothetical protein
VTYHAPKINRLLRAGLRSIVIFAVMMVVRAWLTSPGKFAIGAIAFVAVVTGRMTRGVENSVRNTLGE